MEHLRQSVKMKKRANPLEKIMSKLMSSDQTKGDDSARSKPSASPSFKHTLSMRQIDEIVEGEEKKEEEQPRPVDSQTLRSQATISIGVLQGSEDPKPPKVEEELPKRSLRDQMVLPEIKMEFLSAPGMAKK